MKTTHTPGPWHVAQGPHSHSPFITNSTGKLTVANSVHGATSAEQEANARLIASAPDLLEAVLAIQSHWKAGNFSRSPSLWDAMDSAIAKATGSEVRK